MDSLTIGKVIRSLRSAGIEAGRTDDNRYVWAKVCRVDVETREPFFDTVLIRDVSELRDAMQPTGCLH